MTVDILGRYGSTVVLKNLIVGQNLNLVSIRGFARIDVLAAISAPDDYDQVLNPQGTQRALNPKRSKEAMEYAMESVEILPSTQPRTFTEVILNVRDKSVVHVIDLDSDTEIDFVSTDGFDESSPRRVEVRVDLASMKLPQPKYDPAISRVDGNHRLSAALDIDPEILEDTSSIPVIAFAMYVGLGPAQERSIFRDINSKQAKMETAHLDNISLSLEGVSLLDEDKTKASWALWVANELTKPGKPFDGLVFFGGNKDGIKSSGVKPLLKLNALKDTIRYSIDDEMERQFFLLDPVRESQLSKLEIDEERRQNATLFAMILGWYWNAVKKAFPEAWQDKKEYILFQSIGLYAFGALASKVIALATDQNQLDKPGFYEAALSTISKKVNLSKSNPAWEGVAGLSGGKKVLKSLESALDLPSVSMTALKEKLLPHKSALEE